MTNRETAIEAAWFLREFAKRVKRLDANTIEELRIRACQSDMETAFSDQRILEAIAERLTRCP